MRRRVDDPFAPPRTTSAPPAPMHAPLEFTHTPIAAPPPPLQAAPLALNVNPYAAGAPAPRVAPSPQATPHNPWWRQSVEVSEVVQDEAPPDAW